MKELIERLIELRILKRNLNRHRATISIADDLGISRRSVLLYLDGSSNGSKSLIRHIGLLIHLETHGSLRLDDLASLNSH